MTLPLTMTELEVSLAELGSSPKDDGLLELIVCRPAIGERKLLAQADLHLIDGLVGDNWRARGSKQTDDGSAHPSAQITIMNSRVAQAVAQDRERWPLAGDQLYIDLDLSVENLPPGQHLAIGTAILEVTDLPHTGCAKFIERFGQDAIRFVNSDEGKFWRRRGMNTRIVQSGTIRVSDKATKI